MKKKTKIIVSLIFAAVSLFCLVIAGVVGVLGYEFYSHGGPDFVKNLQQANAEGSEYGKTTDERGCMEKAYTFDVPKNSVDLKVEEFVRGCLGASRPTPDFCDGVTSVLDREYFKDQCRKVGHETTACEESYLAKRNYCRMKHDD